MCRPRAAFAVLLPLALAACGRETTRRVTPWLEMRYFEPTVILPHALALGSSRADAWAKTGSRWQRIERHAGIPFRTRDAVVFLTTRRDPAGGWRPLLVEARSWREGAPEPLRADLTGCRQVVVLPRSAALMCAACGEQRLEDARPCRDATFRELDLRGRVVREFTAPAPTDREGRKCVIGGIAGLDAERSPVLDIYCVTPADERRVGHAWEGAQVSVAAGRAPREAVVDEASGSLDWEDLPQTGR